MLNFEWIPFYALSFKLESTYMFQDCDKINHIFNYIMNEDQSELEATWKNGIFLRNVDLSKLKLNNFSLVTKKRKFWQLSQLNEPISKKKKA